MNTISTSTLPRQLPVKSVWTICSMQRRHSWKDGALVALQLREVPYMVSDRVQNLGAYFVGLNYDYMYVDITN